MTCDGGWKSVPLGDLVKPRETRNPSKEGNGEFLYVDIDAVDNLLYRITRPKRIPNGEAPSRARIDLRRGDVIFSLVRPYLKNIAIVPPELDGAIASTAYCVLRPKDGVDTRFLFYQLIQDHVIHSIPTYGTSPPAARDVEFLRTAIRVTDEREQSRIADKLDELFSDLDAGVAALQRAKVNLARYRAAVLEAAVEGKLTEQWRREHVDVEPALELLKRILIQRRLKWEDAQLRRYEEANKKPPTGWKARYREPRSANVSQLDALPPKWCWATVEQLSTAVVDGVHRKPHYVDSGVPFVTVRNLTAGPGISFERLNYITEEDHEQFMRRTHPEHGDILLSKDGTLGVVRVIRTDRVFSIFVSVALIKPVLREMSDYFGMALASPQVQEQMVPKGSGLQHIHLEDLRQDAVPLAPFAEQARILTTVEGLSSEAQHTAATLESASKRASRIRQAILKSAFEGRLK